MKQIRANEQIKQQLPHAPEERGWERWNRENCPLKKICCDICEQKRQYGQMILKWETTWKFGISRIVFCVLDYKSGPQMGSLEKLIMNFFSLFSEVGVVIILPTLPARPSWDSD